MYRLYSLFLCLGYFIVSGQDQIKFEIIGQDQGLSSNSLSCLFQDSDGFIWIGTRDGLNRYDGVSIETFRFDDGINFISAISEAEIGGLWLGTVGSGLVYFDPKNGLHQKYKHDETDPNSIGSNTITFVHEDRNSRVWLVTNNNGIEVLDQITGETKKYNNVYENLAAENVRYFFETEDGEILIGTNNGIHLYNVEHDLFRELKPPERFLDGSVRTIYEDNFGTIWIGYVNGLVALSSDTWELEMDFPEFNQEVNTFWNDLNNNLWVATRNGLSMFNRRELQWNLKLEMSDHRVLPTLIDKNFFVYTSDFIAQYSVYSTTVLIDDRNRFWMHTNDGLDVYDPEIGTLTPVRSESPFTNLVTNLHTALVKDESNSLWFGGIGSGLNRHSISNFKHFAFHPGMTKTLAQKHVVGLSKSSSSKIWVSANNGRFTLFDMDKGEGERFQIPGSDALIFSLIEHKEKLWLGTFGDGLISMDLNSKEFEEIGDVNSSGDYNDETENIQRLMVDGQNNFWVGTDDGLYLFDGINDFTGVDLKVPSENLISVFTMVRIGSKLWIGTLGQGLIVYDLEGGESLVYKSDETSGEKDLTSNFITSLEIDSSNPDLIWVGTYGGGLNLLNTSSGEFKSYKLNGRAGNNVVYATVQDNRNQVWFSTNSGLVQFSKSSFSPIFNFDIGDGLQSNEFNRGVGLELGSGEILFGGINGLNSFRPEQVIIRDFEPQTVITSFQLPSKNNVNNIIPTDDRIRLNHNQNFFTINFATLDYRNTARIRYQYRMEGVSSEWIQTNNCNPTATCTNVDPGEYTFELQSTNSNGEWMESSTMLEIEIIPPFWQTWLFRVIMVGFALGGFALIFYSRVRFLESQRTKLNEMVNERTNTIAAKNTEIQKQNDLLKIQFQEIEESTKELAKANKEIRSQNKRLSKAIQELEKAQKQLIESEKMASLGVLTAGLAHELNNPLNFIWGILEPVKKSVGELIPLLKDEKNDKGKELISEISELLENVATGAQKASGIINNLMEISPRGEEGGAELFDLVEVFQSTVNLISSASPEVSITFSGPDKLEFFGNPVEINQVIMNVVRNAVDAKIGDRELEVNVSLTQEENTAVIGIRDTGHGILHKIREKIFEPFFTTRDPGSGTGLGLYISYSIVKKHGGEITVDSIIDSGTNFRITLPISIS